MLKEKLFLVDGHALCYRSFFAIKVLTTSKGQPTNAVYGFVRMIRNILKEFSPAYMAVCFDSKGKTHRQKKFAEYKIHRPVMPDDLRSQIPIIKEVMTAFKIPCFEAEGFEADDIIATLARQSEASGTDVVIVSDDKDMYQLAGEHISVFSSKNSVILGRGDLKEKLGFDPRYIPDYIGIVGDKTDNIPGVKGVGAVLARQLINGFGSLEQILNHLKIVSKPSSKERLILDQESQAIFSKSLALLDEAAPVTFDLETLKVQNADEARLFELFQRLEFRKMAEEFSAKNDQETIEVHDVFLLTEAKSLVERIKNSRVFSFQMDEEEGRPFSVPGEIFIDAGENTVYRVGGEALASVYPLFENEEILKVVYDVKRMYGCLASQNISLKGKIFDVMLAGYLLGPAPAFYDLANLAWVYLKVSIAEEPKAPKQVQALTRLYPILAEEIKQKSLGSLFENIEMPLAYILFRMERRGVNLDLALLKSLSQDCEQRLEGLISGIYDSAGEAFNLNSPKQLSRILFEKLKLPVLKKTKTGFSTNESVLLTLADSHTLPAQILEYRQIAKLKSTYIDALPKLVDSRTGRLHAQFNQTGTETGRLSSSQPNLQNIPVRTELGRQIRKAIIPSEKGLIMVAADYSQIELRILAHLSGDENLIRAFNQGEDIHTFTAALIFDVDENDVTSQMRDSAKRVNFGIIYGMSAFGLASDLKVTQVQAQDFIDRYFLRYPAVKTFMDGEIAKCEEDGYVVTLLNRRRYIPEINSPNPAMRQYAQRQAINTPVQGSAADLMKLAMIHIQRDLDLKGFKSRMISTVHDEVIFEIPESELAGMIPLIRDRMEHAVALAVPVVVTIKAGRNWLEMEEVGTGCA